jgi:hypothetical protein
MAQNVSEAEFNQLKIEVNRIENLIVKSDETTANDFKKFNYALAIISQKIGGIESGVKMIDQGYMPSKPEIIKDPIVEFSITTKKTIEDIMGALLHLEGKVDDLGQSVDELTTTIGDLCVDVDDEGSLQTLAEEVESGVKFGQFLGGAGTTVEKGLQTSLHSLRSCSWAFKIGDFFEKIVKWIPTVGPMLQVITDLGVTVAGIAGVNEGSLYHHLSGIPSAIFGGWAGAVNSVADLAKEFLSDEHLEGKMNQFMSSALSSEVLAVTERVRKAHGEVGDERNLNDLLPTYTVFVKYDQSLKAKDPGLAITGDYDSLYNPIKLNMVVVYRFLSSEKTKKWVDVISYGEVKSQNGAFLSNFDDRDYRIDIKQHSFYESTTGDEKSDQLMRSLKGFRVRAAGTGVVRPEALVELVSHQRERDIGIKGKTTNVSDLVQELVRFMSSGRTPATWRPYDAAKLFRAEVAALSNGNWGKVKGSSLEPGLGTLDNFKTDYDAMRAKMNASKEDVLSFIDGVIEKQDKGRGFNYPFHRSYKPENIGTADSISDIIRRAK